MAMELRELTIEGRPARAHVGGDGPPLLLVHGGWMGARAHWERVWDRLARRHTVIAPDLPGLGVPEQPPLANVGAYARWLVGLLDGLGVGHAVCVGNSFGGSVAWSFAGRAPERCAGLVLVNGIPMPATPPPLLWSGRTRFGRWTMRAIMKRLSFNPVAVRRGFADERNIPPQLRAWTDADESVLLPRFADLLIEGDGPPAPRLAPLLLWGAADGLPGTGATAARKLHASLPGSTLALVPAAGHFPQLEAPDAFAERLEAYVADVARAPSPR